MGLAGTCCLRAGGGQGRLLGEGCLLVAKVPGFRPLAVATAMLYSLFLVASLSLLVMPVPSHAWSRPLWYQVGLDLQPWGCQPNSLDSCRSSLGCPGYWMALGGNRVYPVAGITITTTMMLVVSRVMLYRWRSRVAKGQLPQVTSSSCKHWKRQAVVSDRTLVLRVLHMLDAILVHIEGHLQRLASQQQMQIKGTPTQSG
ncbi:transmembrane protein 89 [Peromyscus californicus insignis]|uniref:transmembrane protein 89 n=1 Tax=Peromyscus californicus insignis TaxID=564181 RepID=UPI0022A777E6|nr:transmembrane protein 89 [Peromyscus californicus insignis]